MSYLDVPVRVWGVWLAVCVALSAAAVSLGLFPSPPECALISQQPSGPEPSVTVWHRVWDCSGSTVVEEYLSEELWDCGAVWEEGQWLEAGCSTVEELEERLEQIRASRSGLRGEGQ